MCDHCAKVTSQKGYAGQVTCKCEHPGKKEAEASKEKDIGGCCGKKERKTADGCCGAKCCAGMRREEAGGCCSTGAPKDQGGCCSPGK